MSVLGKLINARNRLQKKELKKSGVNKFAGYQYFELSDFLPAVQQIFHDVGLVDTISFTTEIAEMRIYDVEDGSFLIFTSPMGSAALKGCHEVQNIGACETYQRRYLYTTAMAISEHDALDAMLGDSKPEVKPEVKADARMVKPVKVEPVKVAPPFTITVSPKGENVGAWLDVIKSSTHLVLDTCSSSDDVMQIFRKNKSLFDEVKAENADFFKEMMVKFTETKNKFKE